MKLAKPILLLLAFLCTSITSNAQSLNQKLPTLLLNEVHNEDLDSDKLFLELVVLKVDDIAHNVTDNKPKVIIDDANSGQNFKSGFLAIKPECLTSVNPGDIIVIHGKNTDVSGVSGAILYDINDPCIEKWEGVPNAQNPSYVGGNVTQDTTKLIKDFMSFSDTDNKIQIRINEVYVNSIDQKGEKNYSLFKNDYNAYDVLAKSMGGPNSPENGEMIETLKGQSPLRIDCSLIESNTASISIDPGNLNNIALPNGDNFTGPYTMETKNYTQKNIEVNSALAYGLDCGMNTITITDINGRSAQCQLNVELEPEITIQTCGADWIDLQTLICDNFDSDCIYFKEGDEDAETLTNFESIPKVNPTFDNYPVVLKFSDSQGNIIHKVQITIDILYEGESCDDQDKCTENDTYDADCNCMGEYIIPAIDLSVEDVEPCQNSEIKFEVQDAYDKYSWYVDGYQMGDEPKFETSLTGLVEVEVLKDECTLSKTYTIRDMNEANVEISASDNTICNENTPVTLSIDPTIAENCKWFNESGTQIASNTASIEITEEGEYTVEIQECKRAGVIDIRPTSIEDYKISPANPTICQGGTITLTIEPEVDPTYTIEWSTGETTPTIDVTEAKDYSFTVTSPNTCEVNDHVEVLDVSDLDKLDKFMKAEGFKVAEYQLPENFKPSSPSSSVRSGCDVQDNSDVVIELESFDGTINTTLNALVQELMEAGCNACDFTTGGYIDLYECTPEAFDMDQFLGLGSDVDGYVKTLAVRDEAKDKLLIYYEVTFKAHPKCVHTYLRNTQLGEDIMYDLICAIKNEDPSLTLNYLVPNYFTSFEAEDAELLPPSDVLVDKEVVGKFATLKFANFLKGKSISVPNAEQITPIYIDELCVQLLAPSFPRPDLSLFGYWVYKFSYCDVELSDPSDSPFLHVYIHESEKEDFHKILTELTHSHETTHEIFDPNGLTDYIIEVGFYSAMELIPPCLLSDELTCELIQQTIHPNEGVLGAWNLSERAKGLSELLKTNSKDDANKILNCIHNDAENGPYLVDDIHESFGYNYDEIYESLTNLFYSVGITENIEDYILDDEIYIVFAKPGIPMGWEKHYDQYTEFSRGFVPTFLEAWDGYKKEYHIYNNFYHYQPYFVDVTLSGVELPVKSGLNQMAVGIVPGLYIPYLFDKADDQSTKKHLIASALTAGTVLALGDVAILWGAGELGTLKGAFAVTDLAAVTLDLFLATTPICEGDKFPSPSWCETWKEISTEVAIFSLVGRVTASKAAQMKELSEEWVSNDALRKQVKSNVKDDFAYNKIDDMLRSVIPNLKAKLKELYPRVQPSSILDEIVDALPDDASFLTNPDLVTRINQLSDDGTQIMTDILSTATSTNKLGKNLNQLHKQKVDAFEILQGADEVVVRSFRSDLITLNRLNKDLVKSPSLKTYLKNNSNHVDEWFVLADSYRSLADPVKDVWGSGKISHPNEWNDIVNAVESAGGRVRYTTNPKKIAYEPGLGPGQPGNIIIREDASISALRHEYRHFLDDQAEGFIGFRGLVDPNWRVTSEYNAYKIEIEDMLAIGNSETAQLLKNNFRKEVDYIMLKFSGPDVPMEPSVLELIDELLNL